MYAIHSEYQAYVILSIQSNRCSKPDNNLHCTIAHSSYLVMYVVVIGIVKYQLAIMTNQQREISNKKLPHVFIYVSTICIYIIYIYIPQKTLRCISAGLYANRFITRAYLRVHVCTIYVPIYDAVISLAQVTLVNKLVTCASL